MRRLSWDLKAAGRTWSARPDGNAASVSSHWATGRFAQMQFQLQPSVCCSSFGEISEIAELQDCRIAERKETRIKDKGRPYRGWRSLAFAVWYALEKMARNSPL